MQNSLAAEGPVSFLCVPSSLLKSSNDCEKNVNHDNHGAPQALQLEANDRGGPI